MRDELSLLRKEESELEQQVEAARSQMEQLERTSGNTNSAIKQVGTAGSSNTLKTRYNVLSS
jgi:predicted  nucleic acid-binding Zn-ribbon protein